jgi:sigma-B regulation protein RsbU (phosphoserine phosphatase)
MQLMSEIILVIDDSEQNLELLECILTEKGYWVLAADCAEKALEQMLEVQPDLILLDIMMPGIDGFELCKRFKQQERTAEIPVIFLSGMDSPHDKVHGLELGAVDYITKPFDSGEVLARVDTQLRLRRLTNSLQLANEALSVKQKELERDLRAAALIQQALVPRTAPDVSGLMFAWHFNPCEQIGGDLFNILPLTATEIALYVLDVSGHGVPSAMVTFSIAQALTPETGFTLQLNADEQLDGKVTPPRRLMELLEIEFPIERFDRYFTISYLLLNIETGHIRYSNAGHPPPVLLRKNGKRQLLSAGGPPIGLGLSGDFCEGEAQLEPNDRLYLYTDGVTEYCNADGSMYGIERFYHSLSESRTEPLGQACDHVLQAAHDFAPGIKQQDDLILFGVEYAPARAE